MDKASRNDKYDLNALKQAFTRFENLMAPKAIDFLT